MRLKTPISETSGSAASIESLIEHAEFFDLTPDEGCEKIRAMAEVITSDWVSLARELGMREEDIAIYRSAFEYEDMQLALALGDPAT